MYCQKYKKSKKKRCLQPTGRIEIVLLENVILNRVKIGSRKKDKSYTDLDCVNIYSTIEEAKVVHSFKDALLSSSSEAP